MTTRHPARKDAPAPSVELVFNLPIGPFRAAVRQATNLTALSALHYMERERARPRKTRLRALEERIEVLTEWKEVLP